MPLFPVSEEKNKWLQDKMEALGIHEKDIEEQVRSILWKWRTEGE